MVSRSRLTRNESGNLPMHYSTSSSLAGECKPALNSSCVHFNALLQPRFQCTFACSPPSPSSHSPPSSPSSPSSPAFSPSRLLLLLLHCKTWLQMSQQSHFNVKLKVCRLCCFEFFCLENKNCKPASHFLYCNAHICKTWQI